MAKRKEEEAVASPEAITTPKQAEDIIRAVGRTCRGPYTDESAREAVTDLMRRGEMEQARQLEDGSRNPCGYDVNEIVVAGPWDGEDYEVACPGCGQKITYRAPSFPGLTG